MPVRREWVNKNASLIRKAYLPTNFRRLAFQVVICSFVMVRFIELTMTLLRWGFVLRIFVASAEA
jgi:hypothetical protein